MTCASKKLTEKLCNLQFTKMSAKMFREEPKQLLAPQKLKAWEK